MRFSSVVLLILLFSAQLRAQSTTGTIVGTVTDSSGLAMSGVSVVAMDVATNNSRKATTDDSGVFSIPNLDAGTYRVEFQKTRFKKSQATIELPVSETRRLKVSMEVGPIDEVV